MKFKGIVIAWVLVSLSFSVLHAFAIDIADDTKSHLSEYISAKSSKNINHDDNICDIHSQFHTTFIIPNGVVFFKDIQLIQTHTFVDKIYKYNSK